MSTLSPGFLCKTFSVVFLWLLVYQSVCFTSVLSWVSSCFLLPLPLFLFPFGLPPPVVVSFVLFPFSLLSYFCLFMSAPRVLIAVTVLGFVKNSLKSAVMANTFSCRGVLFIAFFLFAGMGKPLVYPVQFFGEKYCAREVYSWEVGAR